MKRIEVTDLNDETYQWIVNTLKTKLSIFDYVTEEGFKRILREGNYIVLLTDHLLLFCEVVIHATGLKTISVNVIKHSKEDGSLEHSKDALKEIEGMAKHLGIDRVLLEGRIGWTKVFPDYNVDKVILHKDL